jgi:hypothetical protein
MELPVMATGEETVGVSPWNEAPPPKLEEQELDLLALELWQRGSCPELVDDEGWSEAEKLVGYHASCL